MALIIAVTVVRTLDMSGSDGKSWSELCRGLRASEFCATRSESVVRVTETCLLLCPGVTVSK